MDTQTTFLRFLETHGFDRVDVYDTGTGRMTIQELLDHSRAIKNRIRLERLLSKFCLSSVAGLIPGPERLVLT